MKNIIALIVFCLILVGCGPSVKVSRLDENSVTDVSGRWNDSDSRLVAEKMISGMLKSNWLNDYQGKTDKKPAIIVGTVQNLSSEHIENETFIKDMERELLNSGSVTFVASAKERNEIRNERLDQQSNSTEETAKKLSAEKGADYMLKGSIKTISDAIDGTEIKTYQIDLQLINLENNEKVWIDTKKIKKEINKSGYKL
jgi:penicillin-binding protein activator